MRWYDPRTWFPNRNNTDLDTHGAAAEDNGGLEIICSNPMCGMPIRETEMCYVPELGRLYHMGDCQNMGVMHEVLESYHLMIANSRHVSKEQALDMIRKGGITLPSSDKNNSELPKTGGEHIELPSIGLDDLYLPPAGNSIIRLHPIRRDDIELPAYHGRIDGRMTE